MSNFSWQVPTGTGQTIAWTTVEDALRAWVVAGSGLPDASVIWAQQAGDRPAAPWISINFTSLTPRNRPWGSSKFNLSTVALTVGAVNVSPTNTLSVTNHGLVTGQGPLTVASTVSIPGGLAASTDYWPIVLGPSTFGLAATFAGANAGTALPITSAGSGTITLASTTSTSVPGKDITRYTRGARIASFSIQCFAAAPTGVLDALAIVEGVVSLAGAPSRRQALNAAGIGVARFSAIRSMGRAVNMTQFEPRALVEVTLHLASEVAEFSSYIAEAKGTSSVTTEQGTVKPGTFDAGRVHHS